MLLEIYFFIKLEIVQGQNWDHFVPEYLSSE